LRLGGGIFINFIHLFSSCAGDGVLNFTEFIDLMVNDRGADIDVELELIEAFHSFDTEDTGMVNARLSKFLNRRYICINNMKQASE
jgi:Ca2+-binding EF-hand superfamily protein